ncbi:Cytochrome P450 2G1 [Bulinus truncatus]|nr:Cytochrome P450 2G1 [Bulinus truncatus]
MDYVTTTYYLAITSIVICVVYLFSRRKPHYPPCPVTPLPVVGNLFSTATDQRSMFKKWREKCGDIFCVYIGSQMIVVLNGYDLIKETLVKRAADFSDRPLTSFDTATGYPDSGVITSSGKVWKEHRTLTLTILRGFGLGNNLLAERIQDEVNHCINHLASWNGQPTDIRLITNMSTSNVMCSILFGQRFDYADSTFRQLVSYLDELFHDFYINTYAHLIPVLRYLPGDLFREKRIRKMMIELFDLFEKLIEKCRKSSVSDNLIAAYLEEMGRRRSMGVNTTMSESNLKKIIFDLFVASSETSPSSIYWFVLYMVNCPEIQEKIFDEIRTNVGIDRVPTLQDKLKLPYMEATILETQRLSSIAPNSFPHTCPRDVTIRGFTVPKGAYISPCLDTVMYDEKIWGDDVMRLRPERFLGPDGKVRTPEEFIPFSIGRRECVGKSFAKAELFIYVSNLVQRFEFLPVDPLSPPSLGYRFGLTTVPERYQVRVVARRN